MPQLCHTYRVTDREPPGYALYLRKSKGRAGISRQRVTTTAHVEKLGGVIIAEFVDTDRTAYRKVGAAQPKRDNFTAMLALLRSSPGLGVAAWHADRLTRNEEDTAELGRVCAEGGHPVVTKSGGGYDMSSANGRKRFRDDASDAQYEVDHARERILAAKAEAAAEGRWLGGRRPFGWQRVRDEPGVLALDPVEAPALSQAHADLLGGASLHAISRAWNAAGLTTSTGRQWTPVEVRRVMQRPMNAAPPPAKWPAVVDMDAHRAVVGLLARPGRRTTTGPERKHLLSGIARCGTCGRGMVCSMSRGSGRTQTVYRCRSGAEGSGGRHVMREKAQLEAFISEVVIGRFAAQDIRPLLAVRATETLFTLRRERATTEEAMRTSNSLRRRQLLSAEEFAEERAEHIAALAALDGRIAAAEAADVLIPMLENPAEAWAKMDLDHRRLVVSKLMTITVMPAPKGRPRGWRRGQPYFDPDYVEIEWLR